MTNIFATVVVAGVMATNSFRLGGVPTDRVESDIEYAGRLNKLGLLAGALNVTLEAIEGLRVRNLGLAAAVSNLTARVEALERRPQIDVGSPVVTNVLPYWTFPTNWAPWGTGVSVWITNTPCRVVP
jgi:hypothetical protein